MRRYLLPAMALSAAGALAASAALGAPKAAPAPAVSFTEAQAAQGAQVYAVRCAMCHGRDLEGTVETPALTGRFVHNWAGRPVGDLFDYLARAMPQFAPGSLGAEDNARVIAYILGRNGYRPGASVLPASSGALKVRLLAPPSQLQKSGESGGTRTR